MSGAFNFLTSGAGQPLTIALGDLDFSNDEVLVGFSDLFSSFQNTTFSFTQNSLTFNMTDGPIGPGVILSGTFDTAAIPLPATAPLLAFALAGVFALRRFRL